MRSRRRAVPGHLVGAAAARPTSPSRSRRPSPASGSSRGSGRRPREVATLEAGARRLYGERLRAARLTARLNPALRGAAHARPGRGDRPRRLARAQRVDHPRHVPRVHHLRRRARRARPGMLGALVVAGPARPGGRRAGVRPGRLAARRRRPGAPGRAARRARSASSSTTSRSATRAASRCSTGVSLARRAGRDARAGRAAGLGQVDGRAAAAALLRPAGRASCASAGVPLPSLRAGRPAPRAGRGVRGGVPVLRHHPGQHRLRPPRRHRRRGAAPPRGPRRSHAFVDEPARRLRHAASASAGSRSPAGSGSGSRWPGRCSPTRGCWCSTTPRPRSTPPPRPPSTRPCARSPPGRTTLLVAHRRSTLALADRIAVLDGGRVVDVGTEAELAARCALFRELFATRRGRRTAEAACAAVAGSRPELWPAARGPTADAHGSAGRAGGRGWAAARAPCWTASPPPRSCWPRWTRCRRRRRAPAARRDPTAPDPGFRLARLLRPVRRLRRRGRGARRPRRAERARVPRVARLRRRRRHHRGASPSVLRGRRRCSGSASSRRAGWSCALQTVVTARAGESVLYLLRVRSYAHLQRLGLDYYERELSGRIMTRMTTDVDALSTFLQTGLAQAVVSLLTVVGVAVALLVTDLELALVALAVLPLLIVATVVFRRLSSRAYAEAREKVSVVNADLQENVVRRAGGAGLRARGAQRHRGSASAATPTGGRGCGPSATSPPSSRSSPCCPTSRRPRCSASARPGWPRATCRPGVLTAFLLYLAMFFTPVQQLSQVFDGYQQAARRPRAHRRPAAHADLGAAGARRRRRCPCRPGCAARWSSRRRRSPTRARVEPARGPALSLHVRARRDAWPSSAPPARASPRWSSCWPGSTTSTAARCSSTGSTCAATASPTTATGSAWCRRSRTCSPATSPPTSPTRAPTRSPAEIEAAARAVGALELVRGLPGGFRHPVGERGQGLSAGQRQLIALARAELVDPDLLLFDEATAALDPATEAAVLAAGDRVTARRTAFVVAHRLATAARADRVVVLDGGPDRRAGHPRRAARGGRDLRRAVGGRGAGARRLSAPLRISPPG